MCFKLGLTIRGLGNCILLLIMYYARVKQPWSRAVRGIVSWGMYVNLRMFSHFHLFITTTYNRAICATQGQNKKVTVTFLLTNIRCDVMTLSVIQGVKLWLVLLAILSLHRTSITI